MLETLIVITFAFLLVASLHDLKTKEVPDYLSYLFMASGILIQAYYLAENFDLNYLLVLAANSVCGTAFGFIMYYARQWGGADAKLITGLSIYMSNPHNPWLFANYFLNFLLVGAFYGIIGSSIIILANAKKFGDEILKDFGKNKAFYVAGISVSCLGVITFFSNPFLGVLLVLLGFLLVSVLVLKNADALMIKSVPISKLVEGDWLIDRIVVNGRVLFDPKKSVDVRKDQLEQIKNSGVKKVRIRDGIPFIPSFLIAFIVTVLGQGFSLFGVLTTFIISF